MATGKQGFVQAPEPRCSVFAQREDRMHVQAPLTTVYVHAVPGLPPHPQALPPAARDTAAIPLSLSTLCSKQTLPFLTLHIASGTPVQPQRPGLAASAPRHKSAGKHVCQHCGRDCLKPSVLEKHLRCHTGERPYPCGTCGVSFKTQSNLYKHKRTQAHARLYGESERGSLSSQDSLQSSRDTCSSSSPSLDAQSLDLGCLENNDSDVPIVTTTTVSSAQANSTQRRTESDTGWALHQAAVVGLILAPVHGQQETRSSVGQRTETLSGDRSDPVTKQTKNPGGEGQAPLTTNRHLPLQRQEATFFSKLWESSVSRGKSQSHDSTDSGFSESGEQHWTSGSGSILHDPSMESLTESSMELQEQPGTSQTHSELALSATKSQVSVQEKRKLEERISKLISENDALVDDKHLENVRPRKTVLSKQGSIDLPMPYTYKDSFHFEMRNSKNVSSWHKPDSKERQAFYSSVPTQQTGSLEHAPLTRSSSLPFSVCNQHCERTSTAAPYDGDNVTLGRRSSAGHLYPVKFGINSVDQQASSHRSLVRQAAVDGLPTAEGSPVEKSCLSSLSSDRDGTDTGAELNSKKCRRKKAQKFAYHKWYMYGGGTCTFKKLYSTEKDSDRDSVKARKSVNTLERGESQEIQSRQHQDPVSSAVSTTNRVLSPSVTQPLCHSSCPAVCLPPAVKVHLAQTHSPAISSYTRLQNPPSKNVSGPLQQTLTKQSHIQDSDSSAEAGTVKGNPGDKSTGLISQHCVSHLPSERKKQRTEENVSALVESIDPKEKGLSVLAVRQADVDMRDIMNPSVLSLSSGVNQKSTSATEQRDSNRLHIHRQSSFIQHHSNQRHILLKRNSSPLCVMNVSKPSGLQTSVSCSNVSTSAKANFLPKYQLKLPYPADGGSYPATSAFTLNGSTPTQAVTRSHQSQNHPVSALSSVQCQPAATIIVSTQTQSNTPFIVSTQSKAATPIIPSTQIQSFTPITASTQSVTPIIAAVQNKLATPITDLKNPSMTLIMALTQNQSYTPITASAQCQPVTTLTASVQNLSSTAITDSAQDPSATPNIASPQNMSTTPIKTTVQSHSAAPITASMRIIPTTSITVSRQPPIFTLDSPSSGHVNPLDSIQAEVSPTALQSAPFEGNIMLLNGTPQPVAQNTFYVRTADLQIVMQIISDEQLALMESQIETQDYKLATGTDTSEAGMKQGSVSQKLHKQGSHDMAVNICEALECQGKGLVQRGSHSSTAKSTSGSIFSGYTRECGQLGCGESPQNTSTTNVGLSNSSPLTESGGQCHNFVPLDLQTDTLQHQCKPDRMPKDSPVHKARESVGCVDQWSSLELSEKRLDSPDKYVWNGASSRVEDGTEDYCHITVHNQVSTCFSAPTLCATVQSSVVPRPQQQMNLRGPPFSQCLRHTLQDSGISISSQECHGRKDVPAASCGPDSTGVPVEVQWVGCEETRCEHQLSSASNKLLECHSTESPAPPPFAPYTYPLAEGQGAGATSPPGDQDVTATFLAYLSQTEPTVQEKSITEEGELAPKMSVSSKESCFKYQNLTSTVAVHKTGRIGPVHAALRGTVAEKVQRERETHLTHCATGQSLSQVSPSARQNELVSAMLPGQHKLCRAACISPATTTVREITSGSALLHISQHKPLNQRGTHSADEPKTKHGAPVREASTPGKTFGALHESQPAGSAQGWDEEEQAHHAPQDRSAVVNRDAELGRDALVSRCAREDRPKHGELPANALKVNREPKTGLREGGSLQSSELQQEPGTQGLGRIRQGRGETEQSEGRGEAKNNNKWQETEDSGEDKRAGEACCNEIYWMPAEPRPHLSQTETGVLHITQYPSQLDTSTTHNLPLSVCGETNVSSSSQHPGQGESDALHNFVPACKSESRVIDTHRLSSQCETGEQGGVGGRAGRHPKLASSSKEPRTISLPQHMHGRLVAHPLSVTAHLMEVQGKTQAAAFGGEDGDTCLAHTRSSLSQQNRLVPARSEHRKPSQKEMLGKTSASPSTAKTQHCLATHTNPTHTDPTHTDPTHTDATHTGATYTDPTSTNPTHTDPAHTDPTHTDATYTNPTHTDLTHIDPTHTNPTHTDATYTDPTHTDPTRIDPTHTNPTHTDPTYTDPTHTDPTYTDPRLCSLSGSLRSGQSCLEDEENTSSSDDEGKLIIELE